MVQQSRLWIKALGRVGTLRVALDQLFRTASQNGAFLTKRIRAGDNAPCHLSLSLLMFFLQIFFFNQKKCVQGFESLVFTLKTNTSRIDYGAPEDEARSVRFVLCFGR